MDVSLDRYGYWVEACGAAPGTVQRIWWAGEPDGSCTVCGGRGMIYDRYSGPDSCPECAPRVHAAQEQEDE